MGEYTKNVVPTPLISGVSGVSGVGGLRAPTMGDTQQISQKTHEI